MQKVWRIYLDLKFQIYSVIMFINKIFKYNLKFKNKWLNSSLILLYLLLNQLSMLNRSHFVRAKMEPPEKPHASKSEQIALPLVLGLLWLQIKRQRRVKSLQKVPMISKLMSMMLHWILVLTLLFAHSTSVLKVKLVKHAMLMPFGQTFSILPQVLTLITWL